MGGAVSGALDIVSQVAPFFGPVGVVVGIAAGVAAASFAETPARRRGGGGAGFDAQSQARAQMIRGATEPARVIYGTDKLSGPVVFAGNSGASNIYRHVVIALAWHEIDGFEAFYADDIEIPLSALDAGGMVRQGRFANKLQIAAYVGSPLAEADALLMSSFPGLWTSAHRGREVCYLYLRTQRDDTAFPGNRLPNFSARVRGKRDIYDPRTGGTGFTNNAALCTADWMFSPHGLNLPQDRLDPTTFIEAADICDEPVEVAAGGTIPRYTLDGPVFLDSDAFSMLEKMLTACAGTAPYSQGGFKLLPGVFRGPLVTIDNRDLDGEVTISDDVERQERFNAVVGTYHINESKFYSDDSFPAVVNAAYEAEDGERIDTDIALPFTRDHRRAMRIAKIVLERNRRGGIVDWPAQNSALEVPIGETVNVELLGSLLAGATLKLIDNETYLCRRYVPLPGGGIQLKLQREDAASYDWSTDDETTPSDPDPVPDGEAPPPQVTNFTVQQNGALVTFRWDDVVPRAFGFDLAYGPQGGDPDVAQLISRCARGTEVTDAIVAPGIHVFYIWAVDEEGRRSEPPDSSLFTVVNFNDIVGGEQQAPDWPGTLTDFLRTINHALTAAGAGTLTTAAATYAQLFEEVNPDPAAESLYEVPEIDLGFDAAGVRVYGELQSGLIGGDTTGTPNAQMEIQYRLDAGAYGDWEPWTNGILDFRYLKVRLRSDNTTGKRRIQAFAPVVDVAEARQSATNVPIAVGGTPIVFPQEFFDTPNFAAQPAAAGGAPRFAVWDAGAVSATGVAAVRIVTSAETDVGGTLEWWEAVGPLGRKV